MLIILKKLFELATITNYNTSITITKLALVLVDLNQLNQKHTITTAVAVHRIYMRYIQSAYTTYIH